MVWCFFGILDAGEQCSWAISSQPDKVKRQASMDLFNQETKDAVRVQLDVLPIVPYCPVIAAVRRLAAVVAASFLRFGGSPPKSRNRDFLRPATP